MPVPPKGKVAVEGGICNCTACCGSCQRKSTAPGEGLQSYGRVAGPLRGQRVPEQPWPFWSRHCVPWWVLPRAYQKVGKLAQDAELIPEKGSGQSTNNPGNATGGDCQGGGLV